MIRLIAADMDGTLLDSEKRLPKDLLPVLEQLRARDVMFCVASGRQYAALRRDLEALVPHITFICENGALIMRNDERLFIDPLDSAYLPRIIRTARTMEGVYPAVCCADTALLEARSPEAFIHQMCTHYKSVRIVPDLMDCDVRDVCKVAFYSYAPAKDASLPVLTRELSGDLAVIHSDYQWVDVMKPGVDKGRAMRALQKMLGVAPQECMAFGDYLNDTALLESVENSYAMENAHPALKAIAKYIAPSNDEDGVMRVIRERFSL